MSDCVLFLAHVAQSVEHFLGKGEVTGSNPVAGSRKMASKDRIKEQIEYGKK